MAVSTESATKHQKTEDLDKISNLPDPLICYILSFLSTKQAVATGILSNRWRLLWTSVTNLDFNDEDTEDYMGFYQFVSRILLLPNAEPIKKLRLRCGYRTSSNVNTWVCAAMERKVEQIEISSYLGRYFEFPHSLLYCKTIVVLKLSWVRIMNEPSSVHLPLLKTLHLVRVCSATYGFMRMLLSGCPVLEELVVKELELAHSSNVSIEISLPNLVKAEFGFCFWEDDNGLMLNFLEGLSNVAFLSLLFKTVESLNRYASVNDFPMFHNLAHLEVAVSNFGWQVLANLLQSSHKVEVIVIHKFTYFYSHTTPSWTSPQDVPICLSSHLRRLDFRGFEGKEYELEFARYILKNARVLKTMTICCDRVSKPKAKLHILQKLTALPRGSECQILFE
ncbi:FBD-associated F-box protein [Quillaja saponaria]|uniref:FBD-associated F-box protein n=1 Tax=Quillaja saponaria TaxID=32244 RepID=A0AAD7L2K1_QUISA|nr:FBD-associated F-box protein [Quillaja saponaria]